MTYLLQRGHEAVLVVLAAAIPAAFLWVALTIRRGRTRTVTSAAASAAIDVGLLLSLVLIGIVGLRPGNGYVPGAEPWNGVPFRDLVRALREWPRSVPQAAADVAVNIAVFVPFGVFAALRFRRIAWWQFLAVTVAMSFGIEVWQAVSATGRSSDVTDVITNTIGGMLGYVAIRILQAIADRLGPRLTPDAGDQQASATLTD
jgi:hypothetical protein